VKLSPFLGNMANMAERLAAAGVAGLVLFNRFYPPDIDLDELKTQRASQQSQELRLPMPWIGPSTAASRPTLAATSGVYSPEESSSCSWSGPTSPCSAPRCCATESIICVT
jgi:dihydroorotate dehydrogenase (fumarate)